MSTATLYKYQVGFLTFKSFHFTNYICILYNNSSFICVFGVYIDLSLYTYTTQYTSVWWTNRQDGQTSSLYQ